MPQPGNADNPVRASHAFRLPLYFPRARPRPLCCAIRVAKGTPPVKSGKDSTAIGFEAKRWPGGRNLPPELKDLFAASKACLVFVAAFENRRTMQTFVSRISWESEVWIAEDPGHMIHFNGGRFFGPYPDVMPAEP